MKQLIDEQTEIVLKEFEKLHQKFWDDVMSETQAVLDMIERPTRYLNEYINMKQQLGSPIIEQMGSAIIDILSQIKPRVFLCINAHGTMVT